MIDSTMWSDKTGGVFLMVFGIILSTLFLTAFFNPDRNAMTRTIHDYLSHQWFGFGGTNPRRSMLLIAIGGLIDFILGLVLLFVS